MRLVYGEIVIPTDESLEAAANVARYSIKTTHCYNTVPHIGTQL